MFKKLVVILSLILATGCYSVPNAVKPASWIFKHVPKDVSENFRQGWLDGCESGMSSMTNTAYKTFYHYKMDASLRTDPEYYRAWKDTYNYCRHYVYGIIRQGNQRMNLPNQKTAFHSNFLGAEGVLSGTGGLNLWGPGYATTIFDNFGSIGGDPYVGTGEPLDFTDDGVMNGKKDGFMVWDFKNWSF